MRESRPAGARTGEGLRRHRALAALCLTQIVGWGVLYYSFPVALPAITADTRWPQTSVTAAFSAALVLAAGAGVPVGRWIDRHGPRGVMTTGSVLAGASVVGVALAPSLGWFLAAWVVAGLAQSMVLYAPAFTALTRWYGPARGRALLVLTLVAGLASTVFAPVTAALVEHLGWRHAYLVLAALLALVTVPAHAVGLRAPWPEPVVSGGQHGGGAWRPIARSRPFVVLTIVMSLGAFALFAATIHLVPLLTWRGLTAGEAAWALGLSGAGQLLGRLAYGPLVARTSPVGRACVILVASGAAIAAVGVLGGPLLALVGVAVVLGLARGAFTLLQSTAVSDRWGTGGFGALYGILNAPTTVAMAVAPWAAAALEDVTSYPLAFCLLAGVAVAAALGALLTRPPSHPSTAGVAAPPQTRVPARFRADPGHSRHGGA